MEEKKHSPAGRMPYAERSFASRKSFRSWLQKNHATVSGLWIRLYKKDAGQKSVSRTEALDEALCFGWIDGQARPLDEVSWLQKFTPRRTGSGWSKRNTEHVECLISQGLMEEAGFREVEKAKADGRWESAYDSPKNAQPPEDFLNALKASPGAKAFFESLNRANVYAIVYRLQTAKKPETRERRMKIILEMMENGRKFH